jgi:AcrR family transcriptional regulator
MAMPRSGLTPERVTAAAGRLADAEGLDTLSLARLATELDLRPASLFNHVDGLPGLRRELQLRGLREMTAVAERAAASLPAPRGDGAALEAAASRFLELIFAALRAYGLEGQQGIHAARGLFSVVHGFVMLEPAGTFGLPVDLDRSFDWLLQRHVDSLDARPPSGS